MKILVDYYSIHVSPGLIFVSTFISQNLLIHSKEEVTSFPHLILLKFKRHLYSTNINSPTFLALILLRFYLCNETFLEYLEKDNILF